MLHADAWLLQLAIISAIQPSNSRAIGAGSTVSSTCTIASSSVLSMTTRDAASAAAMRCTALVRLKCSVESKCDARSAGPWCDITVSIILVLLSIRRTARGLLRVASIASVKLQREHAGNCLSSPSNRSVALLLSKFAWHIARVWGRASDTRASRHDASMLVYVVMSDVSRRLPVRAKPHTMYMLLSTT